MVASSSSEEIDDLLIQYGKEEHDIPKTASKFEATARTVTKVASLILLIVSVPVGIYAGFKIFNLSYDIIEYSLVNILPVAVNKLINYAPLMLIRLGSKFQAWFKID